MTPQDRRPASTRPDTTDATTGANQAAAPRTVMKLTPAERMIVAMIRQAAAGQDLSALTDLAEAQGACAGRGATIARHGHALARTLDDPDGPDLNVHAIPCRRLSDDEVTVLRLLSASQAGDASSADLYAACLVGTGRVGSVLETARSLARTLAAAGLHFAVAPLAPRIALPGAA